MNCSNEPDREGYSPNFFVQMKDRRIACLTYRKYPGEDWPHQEFFPTDVRLSSGQLTTIRLAERGTWLGDRLWGRDGRRKTSSGICAKAIIWMALLTMVPTLFLTPPWW